MMTSSVKVELLISIYLYLTGLHAYLAYSQSGSGVPYLEHRIG